MIKKVIEDYNYFDDFKIKAEIVSYAAYLRFGYEKLVKDYPNHPFIPMWKEVWGEFINYHANITDKRGGLLLETKQSVSNTMSWLKKEKRKLHATINEIKKYEITNTTKNKPMEMDEKTFIERLQVLNDSLLEGMDLFYGFTDEPLNETRALHAVYSKSIDIKMILQEYKSKHYRD